MFHETKERHLTESNLLYFGAPTGKGFHILSCLRSCWWYANRMEIYLLDIKAVECGSFSLTAQFAAKSDGYEWWLSCIYGPPTNNGKKRILDGINDLGNLVDRSWCIGGAFNEVSLYCIEAEEGNHHMINLTSGSQI